MSSLDTSIANAGLPTLGKALSASFQQTQWIVLAYLLALTTLIITIGRLGDLVGRRRVLLAGIALFTAASALCGLANGIEVLLIARAAQGVGAATMLALTLAFVTETVDQEKLGRAMGVIGTMSAGGTALGPSLGSLLIASIGWRSIFLVNIPIGILALLMSLRYLPADGGKGHAKKRLDILGTVLLGISLGSYALAMTSGGRSFGPTAFIQIAVAVASIILFVLAERVVQAPLLNLAMFSDRVLTSGLVMSFLVSTVIMSTLVVGPFYLSSGLLLRTAAVGLALSVGPTTVALCGFPSGRIADKFGPDRSTKYGLAMMFTGVAMLALSPRSFGLPGYLLPIMVTTAGYALFQTSNNAVVMAGIPQERRGVVSGMLNLSRNLGLITGASAMAGIFAAAARATDLKALSAEAAGKGMHATFGAAGALILVALFISGKSRAPSAFAGFRNLHPPTPAAYGPGPNEASALSESVVS